MSRLFPTGIDLAQKEIKNVAAQNLASAPGSPVTGQFYYDTSTSPGRLYYWNGSAWVNKSTDSDLLQGQNGAYYLARANHTGTQTAATVSDFDTQVNTHKVHQLALATASLDMNSQKIVNVANGTSPGDAINRSQLDSVQQGLTIKQECRVATTANVTVTYTPTGGTSLRGQITAAPNTLDGVSLAASDRLLLKDQSTGAQNGIWVVSTLGTGANGVWDRATDFDQDSDVTAGAFTFVSEGTVNADSGWVLTTNNPITVGGSSTPTALVWAQFSGAGQIIAGAGLTKTGNTLDVGQGVGIAVAADSVAIDVTLTARWKTFLLTGAAASYALTHSLNNQKVLVNVFRNSGSFETIDPDVFRTDANTVTIDFAGVSQVSNTWAATVVG